MAQVTLYLDEETAVQMRRAAKAAGMSQSRWLAEVVRQKTASEWPAAVRRLAGAWADLDTAEKLSSRRGRDVKREKL
jgi:hypothetical protein